MNGIDAARANRQANVVGWTKLNCFEKFNVYLVVCKMVVKCLSTGQERGQRT